MQGPLIMFTLCYNGKNKKRIKQRIDNGKNKIMVAAPPAPDHFEKPDLQWNKLNSRAMMPDTKYVV